MDQVSLGLLPDLVALALVAPVLGYVLFLAPPPEVRLPLRCGVAGSFLFVLASVLIESSALGDNKWLPVTLLYSGHMLAVPSWGLVALGAARLHQHRVTPALEWALRRSPWVFGLFFLAMVTNPLHGQFLIAAEGADRSDYQGLWYLFSTCAHLLGAVTIGIYGWMARSHESRQTRQLAFVMASAMLAPLAANLAYLMFPIPGEHEPTGAGIALSSLIVGAAWYQGPLLSFSSVAFTGLFEHDPNAVILTDVNGRIHYANPSARKLFGTRNIPAGKNLAAALGAELRSPRFSQALGIASMQDFIVDGSNCESHLEYLPGRRMLKLDRFEIPNRRGSPHTIAMRFRDETELIDARRSLTEKTSTLEAVLRSSRDGFFITDMKPQTKYFNARMLKIAPSIATFPFLFSKEGNWRDLLVHFKEPQVLKSFLQALSETPWRDHSVRLGLSDGRTLDVSSTPLFQEGQVKGRVWQIHDATEERRSDEALRNAQKLESLGVMAGGIAHDFNNLLVGVLGNAEIARFTLDENDAALEPLAAVQLAAEQASDLTRQLLAYAGLEDSVSLAPLDFRKIMQETRELLAVVMPPAVDLTVKLPTEPISTLGDASQLRQVLMNLVTNAAEAMEGQAGHISIEVSESWDSDLHQPPGRGTELRPSSVCIRVTDDGCGMDKQTQGRIFDPFFTTKFEGRGLGLAATLGIVRGHGGSIRVESQPDKGTRFEVRLPVHQAAGSAETSPSVPSTLFDGGRVLLVDDEPTVRQVGSKMLQQLGFDVTECSNGVDAIDALRQSPGHFDAVLLDLTMPQLPGLEVAEQIAAIQPDLPVILCSGSPPNAEHERAPVAGFLRKPFGLSQLADALTRALDAPA